MGTACWRRLIHLHRDASRPSAAAASFRTLLLLHVTGQSQATQSVREGPKECAPPVLVAERASRAVRPHTGVTQLVVVLAVMWAWQASRLSRAISDAPIASKSGPRSPIVPCMSVKNSVSGDMSLAVHFSPPDGPSANKQVDHYKPTWGGHMNRQAVVRRGGWADAQRGHCRHSP